MKPFIRAVGILAEKEYSLMFGKRKENKRANVVRKNKKHGSIAVFRLFVFCMLIYCFIMPAYAATESYTIDELYMKVEIPSDLVVFLQDISENDPNITLYGFDKLELEKLYKESHIYLNAIQPDGLYEIVITMLNHDGSQKIFNNNLYKDDILTEFKDSLQDEYTSYGYSVSTTSIYNSKQAKYLVIDFSQLLDNQTVYSKEYATHFNGMAINITLHSYNGIINDSNETTLKSIVDSIVYTNTLSAPSDTYANTLKSNSSVFDWNKIGYDALVGAATAVILSIPFMIKFRRKAKKGNATKQDNKANYIDSQGKE